jgi:hypothetical protein
VIALRAVDATPMNRAAMNIRSSVEPRGMTFSAPAWVRRSSERRRISLKPRTRDGPRLANGKLLIISGIVRIATRFIAPALVADDEFAFCVVHKADAPARHTQSIGPVN